MSQTSTAAPRRRRQPATRDQASYGKIIRNAFGLGFIAALAIWAANPFDLRARGGGGLTNDFLFIVPVIIAAIAIELEHCRRWGFLQTLARLPAALFFGIVWVVLSAVGYLAGQQPAYFALDSLGGIGGQPVPYSARVTVAVIAVALSLAGAALVWTLRIWISERRRVRGPQPFTELAEIFSAVLSGLNRIVHLFTGLVYLAGGVLALLGLKLGSGYLGNLASGYVPPWMETVFAAAGIVAACFLFAKGFQRLLRAASLKPGAVLGPHGSAYTATASDLRRAGILQ